MAKIKLGAIVVAMSGKLGGHVFATNKGGAYMRTKTTPNNPQTTHQSWIRGIFANISSAWSSLTSANRLTWNQAVNSYKRTDIFGDLKVPSGKALFQRLNQNLSLKVITNLTVAPEPAEILTATYDPPDIDATTDYPINFSSTPASGSTLIYSSGPVSLGTEFVKNKMRFLRNTPVLASATIQINTAYTARFGGRTAGQKIFTGVRFMNANGEVSPMIVTSSIVEA